MIIMSKSISPSTRTEVACNFQDSSAFHRLACQLKVTLALDILYAFPGSDGALAQTCLQVGTFGKQRDMHWVLEEKDKVSSYLLVCVCWLLVVVIVVSLTYVRTIVIFCCLKPPKRDVCGKSLSIFRQTRNWAINRHLYHRTCYATFFAI